MPVKWLFDENLYNMDTTYNTSLYFSKMKRRSRNLSVRVTVINEIDGLKNVFKPVFDVGRGF
jgi:hypothetical protein